MRCLGLPVFRTRTSIGPVQLTIALLPLLLTTPSQAFAQEGLALPGCEAPDQLQKELKEKLDPKILQYMTFPDHMARQVEVLDELIGKYPREGEPPRTLIELAGWQDPSLIPAVKDRFEKQEARSPDDPLAQTLAGYSLAVTDGQQAIRKLDQAKSRAAAFPLPYLLLAEIYSFGKTADTKAMTENIVGYFNLCPTSTDREAQRLLAKTGNNDVQARVATALRARLETDTDPSRSKDYETVWALEFRTRPPQEHSALRKQVAADLKHLEGLNPKPDAEFQAFLIRGYKQSDAPPKEVKEKEDRLVREYPRSDEALEIVRSQWDKAHKMPEDQGDPAAWAKWEQKYKDALKTWIRDFPDDYYLRNYAWVNAIRYDDGLSENEVMYVFEADLKDVEQGWRPDPWRYIAAAEFLLQHKRQPQRALEALRRAETLLAKQHDEEKMYTNRAPAEEEERRLREERRRRGIASQTLVAARLLRQPEVAQPVRASVEGPPPTEKEFLSSYWTNRARLAVVENRKADALAYYQLAYQTRAEPPEMWHGKLYDELGDESRALWKELGGTDTAYDVWSKPTTKAQEIAEGSWEKPTRQLPEFELVDLSGKTWRLKGLTGKAVLINVWATWCGPCRVELPHIQKLYEKVKDRPDLQVLTLSADEESGMIEPFLKENGYTFPVLPAYGLISNMFASSFGIPQTWIIDSHGRWQWTELGFSAESNWEDSIVLKLEAANTARIER